MSRVVVGVDRSVRRRAVAAAVAGVLVVLCGAAGGALAQEPAVQTPRILLDVPPIAIEYQLNRLTNDEIARVERTPDDPRYRPVYMAILTRRGLTRDLRQEAIAVLARIDGLSRGQVIAGAVARVPDDDASTAGALLSLLFAQPRPVLASDRTAFAAMADDPSASVNARAAAYGAMMFADGGIDPVWQTAAGRGHAASLVRAAEHLPWGGALAPASAAAFTRVADLVEDGADVNVRAGAMAALVAIRPDGEAFRLLAGELVPGADIQSRDAAVRALGRVPRDAWPAAEVEPTTRRLIEIVRGIPTSDRTNAAVLDAIGLAGSLTEALPEEVGRALRRELRALGVQVVRIAAVPEELRFDRRWFVVQAGRPVEIVLTNPDTMPHNMVIGRPGSLETIGTSGSAMPMPSDPAVKPFVPDSPLVVQATSLVNAGDEARLRFTAPKAPGDYPFVCTFPGHWLRMYGVMVVVDDIDAWELEATPPIDPMTKQPFNQ